MMFTDQEMLSVLRELGAVITDSHIVYTSGKHGSAYINKDAVYPHVATTSRFCETIAERCKHLDIDTVVAPAVGAIILSQWTAHHLSAIVGKEIHAVYAEKSDGQSFVIKRGYDKFVTGRKVLVVEDILNTGGSAKKVVDVVRSIGGNVTGVAVLCNRGGVTAHDLGDVPELVCLANVQMDAWDEQDCPLCSQEVPINTEVGKGREYLAQK